MRLWPLPGCDGTGVGGEHFVDELTGSMSRLITLFTAKGFDGVVERVDACLKVLQTRLASLYVELPVENAVDLQGISGQDGRFFDDAINAVGAIGLFVTLFTFLGGRFLSGLHSYGEL
jgi:hypothetical protein